MVATLLSNPNMLVEVSRLLLGSKMFACTQVFQNYCIVSLMMILIVVFKEFINVIY